MADCLITCITKPHPQSPYEHITHLGNPSAANGGWVWPREKVIASIEDKSNSFYVEDPVTRKRAVVEVRREAGRAPFLQTHADGYWNDNLLSLTQCPLKRS